MDKIEVRDNGIGISHSDVEVMCLRSYTSKISNIFDLGEEFCKYSEIFLKLFKCLLYLIEIVFV